MFKLVRSLFILAVALVVTALIWYNYQITAPISNDQSIINFEVIPGEGVSQISQKLTENGLIRSQFYFQVYVWTKDLQRNFIAGVHELSSSMNIKEMASILTQPGSSEYVITIIEGWNNKEIGSYLENQGLFSQQNFFAEVSYNLSKYYEQYDFLSDKPQNVDLEGYLFPDTYRVFKNASPEEVVKKMLDNFDNKFSQDLGSKIQNQGKSIFEIINLASIIEKEVRTVEDMKMVADIFYKRLDKGIALQSDASINYITGKGMVQPSFDDTKIVHPYNTYVYPGLPPGPISNPGLNAIIATIEPTPNPYYYFLTTREGEVIYSKTFAEHSENKAKYLD